MLSPPRGTLCFFSPSPPSFVPLVPRGGTGSGLGPAWLCPWGWLRRTTHTQPLTQAPRPRFWTSGLTKALWSQHPHVDTPQSTSTHSLPITGPTCLMVCNSEPSPAGAPSVPVLNVGGEAQGPKRQNGLGLSWQSRQRTEAHPQCHRCTPLCASGSLEALSAEPRRPWEPGDSLLLGPWDAGGRFDERQSELVHSHSTRFKGR